MGTRTDIIFQVDPGSLSGGGTFEAPAPINHPNMKIIQDGGTPVIQGGDYVVRVTRGEQILIWLEDPHQRTSVVMAPVRFVASTWNGNNITLDQVTGSDSPLSRPNFRLTHDDEHGFVYTGQQTNWETTNNPTLNQYFHGVDAPRDGSFESPRRHHPYVSFAMNDYLGTLFYGLEFTAAVDGDSKGYFWFDPYIRVVS
ncbi:MAG: hypothetical protein AAF657_23910 [Acidobacteriota bacterium]